LKAEDLKRYIYINNRVDDVLKALGCHSIRERQNGSYYSCAMPDGDNKQSTIIYNEEFLGVQAYTRMITDKYGVNDILSLVAFIRNSDNFTENIKWVCDVIGLDYYSEDVDDLPESIRWTRWMQSAVTSDKKEDNERLKPVSEKVLTYYKPYLSHMFYKDGIPYDIQKQFEIMYDLDSHRIVMPIRDELGTLVGVKGRAVDDVEDKYIYLEPCAKTQVLYGLYENYDNIKKANSVIVVESEKSVMKLTSYGVLNCVAIGGHTLSRTQIEKLIRLNIDEIILCYDEDVFRDEDGVLNKQKYKSEVDKFISQQSVSIMVDINKTILDDKESPADNEEKFFTMYKKRQKVKRGVKKDEV